MRLFRSLRLQWLCACMLALSGCGGGGAAGVEPNIYYHFACNGDSACLSTNFAGASTGTSNQGPGQGGQAGCNGLMNFGNINWNIPPAQQWCDTSAGFNPPPTPSVTLTLTPSTIDQSQTSTLSWTSTLVSSCTASGKWSGTKATSGSVTVSQANQGSYTYGLSCTGSSGSASDSAVLTVTVPPPQVNLTVSPASITLGQSAGLTWSTYQFTSCSASGAWGGSVATSGTQPVVPSAAGTYTYTLSCLSATNGSRSDSATLVVNPVSGPLPTAPAVSLAAGTEYPSCITTGDSMPLTWSSTDTTSCTASGAWTGATALSGSQSISPGANSPSAYSTFDYTLDCAGPGGSASATVKICVVPPNGGTWPPVTLSFIANPPSISLGESTSLEWVSQYASRCTATDDWTGLKSLEGKQSVTPATSRAYIYLLTCQSYLGSIQKVVTLGVQAAAGSNPSAARFYRPLGLSIDASDNLYIADSSNHTIRRITPSGQVTTVAGQAGYSGSTDGVGAVARFYNPEGVGAGAGGLVYVADLNNNIVRKIAADSTVTTLAGSPGTTTGADGTGSAASFYRPYATVVDSAGDVFMADGGAGNIRKITADGVTTTFAGQWGVAGYTDGTGTAARFGGPAGLAFVGTDLYVTDYGYHNIRKITSGGVVTTFAGMANTPGSANGTGTAAGFYRPYGIDADSQGNLFVVDSSNFLIRKITVPGAVVTTFAGSGSSAYVNGTGTGASFVNPAGLAIDSQDNVYVTDAYSIRKITPAGVVTTYAGEYGTQGSNN